MNDRRKKNSSESAQKGPAKWLPIHLPRTLNVLCPSAFRFSFPQHPDMKFIYKRKFIKRILFGTLIAALLIFAVIFIVIPVIYRYSYVFQRNLLFLNFVSVPVDFKHPEKLNLMGARNFYVRTDDNVTIGVWHILPSKFATSGSQKDTTDWLNRGDPIFVYMHGNSGNRGTAHRLELYRLLQKNNFHIIAFDYRSYGDSSPVEPSETGVVNDSKHVYEWVKLKAGSSPIFLWGHSLGSGIASHLLDILEKQKEEIQGLVLESPFNNMSDEIRSYPLARIFKFLPWFDYFFIQPMYDNGLRFESDVHLSKVSAPIMILHAEDDIVIPIDLGEKLSDSIKKARISQNSNSPLIFHPFSKNEGLGHKNIYRAAELPLYILDFVNNSLAYNQQRS
ncbi:lysophosphatidylserine lipase ABHD12 isoform X2 [Rhodnius prolixus]|uniref:lysophosphatidylserine lipase ABHD12 isoform X2 n=1 Tax=Rhodnius prolixus TaxID=13249 RepID=UPI003D18F790